jgi:hypothetical protein
MRVCHRVGWMADFVDVSLVSLVESLIFCANEAVIWLICFSNESVLHL